MGSSEKTPYFALLVRTALLHLLNCPDLDPRVFSFCSSDPPLPWQRGLRERLCGCPAAGWSHSTTVLPPRKCGESLVQLVLDERNSNLHFIARQRNLMSIKRAQIVVYLGHSLVHSRKVHGLRWIWLSSLSLTAV